MASEDDLKVMNGFVGFVEVLGPISMTICGVPRLYGEYSHWGFECQTIEMRGSQIGHLIPSKLLVLSRRS